jgi:hypothetical protein
MIYTTLKRIRVHNPCGNGWVKLLKALNKDKPDDEPLPMTTILDVNGFDDTLWCLRAEPQNSNIWRLLAVKYVRYVEHLMTNQNSINALNAAEKYAYGQLSEEELSLARSLSVDAGGGAAMTSPWDAVSYASFWSYGNNGWASARQQQEKDLRIVLEQYNSMPGEQAYSWKPFFQIF